MKLRILGCSGGIGSDLRTTSLLIDDDLLIDAGTGISELSLDEMAKIRHIFLTHSHLDHIACLPLMIDSIFDRIDQPIVLHGQPPTLEVLQEHIFNWAIWPDFAKLPVPDKPVMSYQEMMPGETYIDGNRQLEMIPVNHIVPAVAYRVESEGKSFAYSGDTTTNDTLWDALNAHDNLDMLVVESAFGDADKELSIKARHYCTSLLAEDLRKLKHDPEIYITHIKPGDEETIFKECQEAITDRKISRLQGKKVFEF